jgi:hypothetical protein
MTMARTTTNRENSQRILPPATLVVEIAYSGSAIDARWHGTDRTCREVRPVSGYAAWGSRDVFIVGRTPWCCMAQAASSGIVRSFPRFASEFRLLAPNPSKTAQLKSRRHIRSDRLRTAPLRPGMSPYPKLLGSILFLIPNYH